MIVFELTGSEQHPVYQALEVSNGTRQYDFLRSIVETSLATGKKFISTSLIKALNFHAIVCLHTSAGEYRPCPVIVGGSDGSDEYRPPDHYRVADLMEDFVNTVNREWSSADPVTLAAYVLWRMNYIHPFINGNGRTARAASYFVLCVSADAWLPGKTILPELIRQNRGEYVAALKAIDASAPLRVDLTPLHALLTRLLVEQLHSADAPSNDAGPAAA